MEPKQFSFAATFRNRSSTTNELCVIFKLVNPMKGSMHDKDLSEVIMNVANDEAIMENIFL